MNKTGQQSRNDLLAWYGVCFLIVVISVGFLYGVGMLGDGPANGNLIQSNKVTAAAVAVPVEKDSNLIGGNSSSEVSDG